MAFFGVSGEQSPKLIGGFFWWFIFGICVIADIFDVLLMFIQGLVAIAGLVVAVGPIVAFFAWVVDAVFDFVLIAVTGGYYKFVGAKTSHVLVLSSLSWMFENIPFVEYLPLLTFFFVLVRVIENRRRRKLPFEGSTVSRVVPRRFVPPQLRAPDRSPSSAADSRPAAPTTATQDTANPQLAFQSLMAAGSMNNAENVLKTAVGVQETAAGKLYGQVQQGGGRNRGSRELGENPAGNE